MHAIVRLGLAGGCSGQSIGRVLDDLRVRLVIGRSSQYTLSGLPRVAMPSNSSTDRSAGYEANARAFQALREEARVGADVVAAWARTLAPGAEVLELGCGAGVPVTEELARAGCTVWGIDASPTLLSQFRERFPTFRTVCEDLASSLLFGRTFHAIVAVGVLFLLSPDGQCELIHRVADALAPGGEFLFTAPAPAVQWNDILTDSPSYGLGADAYTAALSAAGLTIVCEFEDEGVNHYFVARKGVADASARDAG